jgi:hypothetical protein
VLVPGGSFLAARERLHANVALRRIGCSGRGALTLQEPRCAGPGCGVCTAERVYSDTVKDRFVQTYGFADKTLGADVFAHTVLELVRLVQAALGVFGLFDLAPDERNGLLCDATVQGLQRWTAEVGEPLLRLEVCAVACLPGVC